MQTLSSFKKGTFMETLTAEQLAVFGLVAAILFLIIQVMGLMLNILMLFRSVSPAPPRLPLSIKPPQGLPAAPSSAPAAAAPGAPKPPVPPAVPAPQPTAQWPIGQPPMPSNDTPQANPFPKFNMPVFRTPPAAPPPNPLTRDGKSITIEPISNAAPAPSSEAPPTVLP